MSVLNLGKLLSENTYPGRGILIGCCEPENKALLAYFIMGRSENSRNRVFTEKDGGIITEAADPAKMKDPSLIIYAPVRKLDNRTIVTNGDQTDTIYEQLQQGGSFLDALRTRTFEPDAPNFTPRISGSLTVDWEGFFYKLSILKTAEGNPSSIQRFFYEYSCPIPGQGHLIHTYAGDGDPLPSYTGEPKTVALAGGIKEIGDEIWNNLNPENKVALFVRTVALDGEEETILYNKYSKI